MSYIIYVIRLPYMMQRLLQLLCLTILLLLINFGCMVLIYLYSHYLLLSLGRYNDAERDLQTALKLKPDFKDAQDNLQQVQEDIRAGHKFNI